MGVVNNGQELILKVKSKQLIFKKFLQHYATFLPRVYNLIGAEIYIEVIKDGAILFFKSLADFMNFHAFWENITLPNLWQNKKISRKKETIAITVDLIRIPPGINIDELVEKVANWYKFVFPDIKVEKVNDERAIIRFLKVNTLEQVFAFLEQFWDKNDAHGTINPPIESPE